MKNLIRFAALCGGLIALAGCNDVSADAQASTKPQMPPLMVSVVEVAKEPVVITSELPGRVAPTQIAQVRPRVSGIVVKRVFEQGSRVKAGDVLYQLDAQPLEVQVASAEASLKRAKALQAQAKQAADRQRELAERKVSSSQQLDDAIARLAQADADVAVAEAGLAAARLNLEYASVRAPIDGVIGRAMITEGALVSSAESLAIIQQLDPVYVDFTQSAGELLRLRRALAEGRVEGLSDGEASVRMVLDDGSEYPHKGRLLFSEASVDETTGQITLRAEFPNPDGDLLPGLFTRVIIDQGVERDAVAVPQQAIQRTADGKSHIYVVGPEGTASLRTVTLGRTVGTRTVVLQGLESGEKVIVEGFQKVREGAPVKAEPWKNAG